MQSVLGIDTNSDSATAWAHDYRNANVYPNFPNNTVRKLQGPMATRAFVVNVLRQETNIRLITGVGHGLSTLYTGQQNDAVFLVDYYKPTEVRGKIVHLLSCQTAQKLGPDMVANGATAFLGYDVNFSFMTHTRDLFFAADSAIDLALARGATVGEAARDAIRAFNDAIEHLEDAPGVLDSESIAALMTDRDHLMGPHIDAMFGDANARLF